MNTKKYNLELMVGLFVVLGFLSFIFLVLRASNIRTLSFSSTYNITIHFDDIGSLRANAPVKTAGVTVGKVKRIVFNNESFLADVTVELDKKTKFPIDTSASIITSGILGEQYISLLPGNEETFLSNNDVIINTQSALSIEYLVGKLLYYFVEKEEMPKLNNIDNIFTE